MKDKTDVIIAYSNGAADMLDICLSNLFKYTDEEDIEVVIVHDEKEDFDASVDDYSVSVKSYPVSQRGLSGAKAHGTLLDAAVKDTSNPYILSLDSDCFPIAQGWLDCLHSFIHDSNGDTPVSGICHPWTPPPEELRRSHIEWRIRSGHCWNNTHVACQLILRSFLENNGLKYCAGDDTGLDIPTKTREMGLDVGVLMPTNCVLPNEEYVARFNPELNRHVGVIWGEYIYHHGGVTRKVNDCTVDMETVFSNALEEVIKKREASWLHNEKEKSHWYTFENEEAVADYKIELMKPQIINYLTNNQSLFK